MNEISVLDHLSGFGNCRWVTCALWNVRLFAGVFRRGRSNSAGLETNSGAMSADAHLVQSR